MRGLLQGGPPNQGPMSGGLAGALEAAKGPAGPAGPAYGLGLVD